MILTKLSLRLFCLLLVLSISLGPFGSCEIPGGLVDEETADTQREEFDLLMDELFADWVSSDALSMNYYLADPDKLNIERPGPTFGDVVSEELIIESKQETRELLERLNGFTYRSLREDQQIVFDILRRNLALYEILEREEDYSYYTGYIRPLIGIQVQFPILLAEFNFYTAEDIERYLDLMEDTGRYFNDMIEFERERSRRGFFLSESNVDKVTEQIESYLENREDNLLITVFDSRIDDYEGLDGQQREFYKQRNRELVLENVLPAYERLLDAMKELRGVGSRSGGLAELPGGREFAHALLRLRTGSDRSINELEVLLDEWLEDTFRNIIITLRSNNEIYDRLIEDQLEIDEDIPENIVSQLQRAVDRDFPPIRDTRLVILEVHENLQEHMSPAFYLAPAIDRFNDNVVYVNPASISSNLFMFTALAHESYPGHMYQTVYFLQQTPHPVRVSLSNTGYSEGWATYAEMRSYFFTDLDYEEAGLMWNFRLFDLLLQANIDFGVNVLGWSFDDAFDLLKSYNYNDMEIAESIYNNVTGMPLTSLNYSLGFIELTELINEAINIQGNSFELIEFHRFFLEFGPAPYPLLREHMIARFGGNT